MAVVKTCIVASGILIRDGKTLLLKHKKLGVWIYPGGHVDDGEIPTDCVLREIREETGFSARLIRPYDNGAVIDDGLSHEVPQPFTTMYENVHYKDGTHIHYDLMFLAEPVGQMGEIDSGESKELGWFGREEVKSLDTFDSVRQVIDLAFRLNERLHR